MALPEKKEPIYVTPPLSFRLTTRHRAKLEYIKQYISKMTGIANPPDQAAVELSLDITAASLVNLETLKTNK